MSYSPGFETDPIEFQIREITFLLLPVVNLLCRSKKRVKVADKKLQILILIFISIVVATEVVKHLYFGGGLGSAVKTIRIGLPLFSCLTILFFGLRADIEKVWRTVLWAISASAIFTFLTPFVYLPIYPIVEGENIIEAFKGRFINANASFGIVGIYLLYKDQDRWYNKGWLPKLTAIMGIIILILTFNRTYLALLAFAFIYLSLSEFTLRKVLRYVLIPLVAFGFFLGSYNYFDVIQRQVDKRILNIVLGQTDLLESVYKGNREVIVKGVSEKLADGYWFVGMPIQKPIFKWYRPTGIDAMSTTDTSFINILLRYGLIPFTVFFLILMSMFKKAPLGIFRYTLIIFSIASLNIDALLRHNSIFFLTILFFVVVNARK